MIVEVCDPNKPGDGVCSNRGSKLNEFARKRQSLYLTRPLVVLKDQTERIDNGNMRVSSSVDNRLKKIAQFRSKVQKQDHLHKWAVLLDHQREVECCNEVQLGQQYLVMGVPLPTVDDEHFNVIRLWGEIVTNTLETIASLLQG